MAQVIFTGRGAPRQNPLTQVFKGLHAGGANAARADAINKQNQALSGFAGEIQGGAMPAQSIVNLLKTNPSAALGLAQSGIPGILEKGQAQFQAKGRADLAKSAADKIFTSVREFSKENGFNANKLFTKDGQVNPAAGVSEDQAAAAVVDAIKSLTPEEYAAFKDDPNMQSLTTLVSKSIGGDLSQTQEFFLSQASEVAKEKRAETADKRKLNRETEAAIKINTEKAKNSQTAQNFVINTGDEQKIVRVDPNGQEQVVASYKTKGKDFQVVHGTVGVSPAGIPIEQMFLLNKSKGSVTPVIGQDGKPVQGPKGSIKSGMKVEIGPDGTIVSMGGTGDKTTAMQTELQKESQRAQTGLNLISGLRESMDKGGNISFGVTGAIGDFANVLGGNVFNALPAEQRAKVKNEIRLTKEALLRAVSTDNRFNKDDRTAIESAFPDSGFWGSEAEAQVASKTLQAMFLRRLHLAESSQSPDDVLPMSATTAKANGISLKLIKELLAGGYLEKQEAANLVQGFFPNEYNRILSMRKGNK